MKFLGHGVAEPLVRLILSFTKKLTLIESAYLCRMSNISEI